MNSSSEASFSSTASSSSAANAQDWVNVKIGGGGYVPGLVFHPTTANLLFARTDIGGAYRWNHDATEWTPITDSFGVTEGRYMGSETMALDPTDDNKVYMSNGLYIGDGNGRLSISSDRGDTWTHVQLPFPVGSNHQGRAIGERMMVDPNLPSTLFYGTRTAGLWKSTDSGLTWSQVTSLSPVVMAESDYSGGELWLTRPMGVGIVLFDTSSVGGGSATQSIYATVSPDYAEIADLPHNIYKSSDGGQSWVGVETPISGYHIPHMTRAADGMLYVAFTMGAGPGAGGPSRLYKYDGSTWTLLKSYDPTQWTSFGFGGLSVSGTGATTRIALGITNSWGLWDGVPVVALSDDAGATWREISGFKPHVPDGHVSGWIDDVEIDPSNPDHILHVHGGGVWHTMNASDPDPIWYEMIEGIEETASVAMVTPPAGAPYYLLNSSMDIGTQVHTSLTTTPTLGPKGNLALGTAHSVDMAWSNPEYIATIGHPAGNAPGSYSLDAGVTWSAFSSFPPGLEGNYSGQSNVAVSAPGQLVWAQSNSIPYYTTDNGASWHVTNLPALVTGIGVNRGYHVAADRQNPDIVYAYDHGGAWWRASDAKFFYSHDGGQTFTQSTDSALTLRGNYFHDTSIAVNPYVEGEVWIADGNSLFRSTDSGVTWVKLTAMQSVWGGRDPSWQAPVMFGAEAVALGVPAPGSAYSATVFMGGTVNGIYGVYRSDDMGETWVRINDDNNQFGGIGHMAADHNVYGRVFFSGGGRGVLYNIEAGSSSESSSSSQTSSSSESSSSSQTSSSSEASSSSQMISSSEAALSSAISSSSQISSSSETSLSSAMSSSSQGSSAGANSPLPTPTYGFNLGNTFESTWGFPSPTQAVFTTAANAGFNAVRIPCAWNFNADPVTYQINPAYMAQVKQAVDWSIAAGMHVVINIHWDGGWMENNIGNTVDPEIDAKMHSYWTQIATAFADYDSRLLFAAANEPNAHNPTQMNTLMAYYQTFVNAVRAVGGNNTNRWLVLQGGGHFSWLTTMPIDSTPGRIMVEYHNYTPSLFTIIHTDQSWGNTKYFWGSAYHYAGNPSRNVGFPAEGYTDSEFQLLKEQYVDKGIPVLIGEFQAAGKSYLTGDEATYNRASTLYWNKYLVDSAHAHGLSPFYWSTPNSPFNYDTGAIVDPEVVTVLTGGMAPPPPNGAPYAVSDLSATTAGSGQVDLSWTAVSGATSYNLYRSAQSGYQPETPAVTGITDTFYTDTGLNDGTTYYYQVVAVNDSGASGFSAEAHATTLGINPDPTKFHFETDTQRWVVSGAQIATSTEQHFAGQQSLAVNFNNATGTAVVDIHDAVVPAGATVTFRVWVPAGHQVTTIEPYLQDYNWGWAQGWYGSFVADSWNTVTVTVPANATAPLKRLGLRITTSAAWTGTVHVDSVNWTVE